MKTSVNLAIILQVMSHATLLAGLMCSLNVSRVPMCCDCRFCKATNSSFRVVEG
jgi:hypothetical protein